MSRSNVRCNQGHTALFPGKTEARASMLDLLDSKKDLLTISHGILDVLLARRWSGRVLIADIDADVIEAARYIREGDPRNGKASDYPWLNFLPEFHGDIAKALWNYAEQYGLGSLAGVDVDLTSTVDSNAVVMATVRVFNMLLDFNGEDIPVFVTFRNGRDLNGHNAAGIRAALFILRLQAYLEVKIEPILFKCYRSDWHSRNASRERGSSMAILGVKICNRASKNSLLKTELKKLRQDPDIQQELQRIAALHSQLKNARKHRMRCVDRIREIEREIKRLTNGMMTVGPIL